MTVLPPSLAAHLVLSFLEIVFPSSFSTCCAFTAFRFYITVVVSFGKKETWKPLQIISLKWQQKRSVHIFFEISNNTHRTKRMKRAKEKETIRSTMEKTDNRKEKSSKRFSFCCERFFLRCDLLSTPKNKNQLSPSFHGAWHHYCFCCCQRWKWKTRSLHRKKRQSEKKERKWKKCTRGNAEKKLAP